MGESSGGLLEACAAESLIPIHPDALSFYFRSSLEYSVEEELLAAPSASGRTLLVEWDGSWRWLKLSYPGVLGRFPSPLDEAKVNHSLLIASRLRAASVAFLNEPAGLVAQLGTETTLGALERDVLASQDGRPLPIPDEVLPLFSLSAGAADDSDVDEVLIGLAGTSDIRSWYVESLIVELVRSYFACSTAAGVIPEPHAQNVVVHVSGGAFQVVWRDCQGFMLDSPGQDGPRALEVERSRRFDDYMTRYTLLPLVLRGAVRFGVSFDRAADAVRTEVDRCLAARSGTYFPDDGWFEMPLWPPVPPHRIEYRRRLGRPLFRN